MILRRVVVGETNWESLWAIIQGRRFIEVIKKRRPLYIRGFTGLIEPVS